MNDFASFLSFFLTLPPELFLLIEFMACGGFLLLAERFFGLAGLYVYTVVGIIVGNIAVLKTAQFSFYPVPMALGTIIFSSLFLCSDMITERYGKENALKSVWVGFFGYFVSLVLILITLGYGQTPSAYFQEAISFLLVPGFSLFLASLIAYFVSQYTDIFLYHFLHVKTGRRYLWARSLVSTCLAIFIDNTVFSLLAWHYFAIKPLAFYDIFWTYILGGGALRFVVAGANIPFVYISDFLNKKRGPYVVSLS